MPVEEFKDAGSYVDVNKWVFVSNKLTATEPTHSSWGNEEEETGGGGGEESEFDNVTINNGNQGDVAECGRLKFDEDNQSTYWMVTKRGSSFDEPESGINNNNLIFSYWDSSDWHQLIDLDPKDDYVQLNEGKLQLSNSEVPHLEKLEIVEAIFDFKHGKWGPEGLPVANANTKITFEETDEDLSGHLFEIVSDTPAFNEIEPLLATDLGLVVQKDIAAGGFVSANQGELHLGFGRVHRLGEPAIRLSFADASKLYGGGAADIPPIPKGPQQSSPPASPTE